MDDEDDVWNAQFAESPQDNIVREARFVSVSDPEMSLVYTEGDTSHERTGQEVEIHFQWPRGIGLAQTEDGLTITCEEHGDVVGPMVGQAFLWIGWQMLHQPAKAAEIAGQSWDELTGPPPSWLTRRD